MDKAQLHTLVFFVDDIESTANLYAKLLNIKVDATPHFNMIRTNDLAIGFHPADERSPKGTTVPYFKTDDLDRAISSAASEGFELHRGPIEVDGEKIVQLRNGMNIRVGFVQTL